MSHPHLRAALAAALLATAAALAACGGKSQPAAGGNPAGSGPGGRLLQLPAPSELQRSLDYADSERFQDGALFAPALPHQHVAAEGAALRFSPDWDPSSGQQQIAYAVYGWTLPGYIGQAQAGVTWGEAPAAGSEVWLGASDWAHDRWVWRKAVAGQPTVDFGGILFAQDNGSIVLAVAVLAPAAAGQPLLSQVFVGSAQTVQPGDAQFTVDLTNPGTPISPFVYGTNEIDSAGAQAALPALVRFGGNRYTAYNWENNASNAGNDYFNENDDYFGDDDTPGAAVRSLAQASFDAGADSVLVTVPIQGYVAADKNGGDEHGSGDVINSGPNYLDTRFKIDKPLKGAPFSDPPDTGDGFVYQDEFIHWLDGAFPGDLANGKLMVSLDNEPDLWADTHSRIELSPVTYTELLQKNIDYAAAVKSVVPQALCFGAVNFGFSGYINLQSAPDAGGKGEWLDYYLDGMKAAEATHGNQRLLDVLDVHFYTEAEAGTTHTQQYAGSDDLDAATVAARLQAPRSLWDGTYVENSWITRDYNNLNPIMLIPWLQDKITTHYPGTKLAITEYNYGASADISGGLAEADALGIFGREGLYAATYFALNDSGDPYVYAAMRLFRNYDGQGSRYGDQWVPVQWSDRAGYSAYAASYAGNPGHLSLLLINKQNAAKEAQVLLNGGSQHFTFADTYTLTAAGGPQPVQGASIQLAGNSSFNATLPAMSATLLDLYVVQ